MANLQTAGMWSAGNRSTGRNSMVVEIVKRALDLGGAALLCLLFLPVFVIFAFLVKWQDGGPVIYRRRVVGLKGVFCAFKLRSMSIGAEEALQRNQRLQAEFERSFKLKDDPRVTPVGKV